MSEPMPVLPVQAICYSRSSEPSQALRVLTIVLMVWGATVTLRHSIFWANYFLLGSNMSRVSPFVGAGLAMVEVGGYVVVFVLGHRGLKGDLSAQTGLVIGSLLAAAAVLFAGAANIYSVLEVTGTKAQIGGMYAPVYFTWQIVSELGKVVVPLTCGILILRLKP